MSQVINNSEQDTSLDPVMLTSNEVARYLKISMRTLWRMHSAGRIPPAIRMGGVVRWSSEVIRNWIAEGCPSQVGRENDARRNR